MAAVDSSSTLQPSKQLSTGGSSSGPAMTSTADESSKLWTDGPPAPLPATGSATESELQDQPRGQDVHRQSEASVEHRDDIPMQSSPNHPEGISSTVAGHAPDCSNARRHDAAEGRPNSGSARAAAAPSTVVCAIVPGPHDATDGSGTIHEEYSNIRGGKLRAASIKPVCLFAACWTQPVPLQDDFKLPANIGLCGSPDAQISFDGAISDVDSIIDRLYGAGTASAWAGKHQMQDDESDDEAVEALSHALGEASTGG